MKDVNYLMKYYSFQREDQETTWGQIKGNTEAHQEITWGQIKGMQALHTPWSISATLPLNHCYKTPHQIPRAPLHPPWGQTVLKGMSPLCPPLPGKEIKLSFSTSPQTLSLKSNSAPVHRGWVLGITLNAQFLYFYSFLTENKNILFFVFFSKQ